MGDKRDAWQGSRNRSGIDVNRNRFVKVDESVTLAKATFGPAFDLPLYEGYDHVLMVATTFSGRGFGFSYSQIGEHWYVKDLHRRVVYEHDFLRKPLGVSQLETTRTYICKSIVDLMDEGSVSPELKLYRAPQ